MLEYAPHKVYKTVYDVYKTILKAVDVRFIRASNINHNSNRMTIQTTSIPGNDKEVIAVRTHVIPQLGGYELTISRIKPFGIGREDLVCPIPQANACTEPITYVKQETNVCYNACS